ncbi:MaoC family dehydratase [Microbacterium terregens]|uniref:MaoC family dehydratase n=1 Tax=Microbacterium terregens TaxID=69363 RepID=UPI0031D07954
MVEVLSGVDGVTRAIGRQLGPSRWHRLTQATITDFADATGDHQWIHVDEIRARTGPFGTTIAHGYLTLSLVPKLLDELVRVDGFAMSINYGLNRVRFPAAVPVDSRIRLSATLESLTPVSLGHQLVITGTVEIHGLTKPGCVVESVVLLVP